MAENGPAQPRFSALGVHERFFRHNIPYHTDLPTTIFFCNEEDDWGLLWPWYETIFKGPSDHPYCEEFPNCDECSRTRKTFTSAGHFIEYYKAVLFGDSKTADKILKRGNHCPFEGLNNVRPRYEGIEALSANIVGFNQQIWDQVKHDVMVQAHLWKFGEEAGCTTKGYDNLVPKGIPIREKLLDSGGRSLVESKIDDCAWHEIQMLYRRTKDPRRYDDEKWTDLDTFGYSKQELKDSLESSALDAEARLGEVADDPRFHDEDEKQFWGDNLFGRVLMEVRQHIRNGEQPRSWAKFEWTDPSGQNEFQ